MKKKRKQRSEKERIANKILAGEEVELDSIDDDYIRLIAKKLLQADDKTKVCLMCGGHLWVIGNQLKCGDCLRCFEVK